MENISKIKQHESNFDSEYHALIKLTQHMADNDYFEVFSDLVIRLGHASQNGDAGLLYQLEQELDSFTDHIKRMKRLEFGPLS